MSPVDALELWRAWQAGELDDAGRGRLQRALAEPRIRAALVSEARFDQALRTALGRRAQRRPNRWWPIAIAATLMMTAGGGWLTMRSTTASATVLQGTGTASGSVLSAGRTLEPDAVVTSEHAAPLEIGWSDERHVRLTGSLRLPPAGSRRLTLIAGRVDVSIPPGTAGDDPTTSAGVATPRLLAIVHGTRFAVTTADAADDCTVTEGTVLVHAGDQNIALGAGSILSVAATGELTLAATGDTDPAGRPLVLMRPDQGVVRVGDRVQAWRAGGRLPMRFIQDDPLRQPRWQAATASTPETVFFDGQKTFLVATDHDALDAVSYGTLSAWIMPAQADDPRFQVLFSMGGNPTVGNDRSAFELALEAGCPAVWAVQHGAQNFIRTRQPASGRWQHIAYRIDAAHAAWLIDGEVINTFTADRAPGFLAACAAGHSSMRIGCSTDDHGEVFHGALAELRVDDRALTDAEIAALVAAGPPRPSHTPAATITTPP
jgi:ferric-dicitrate binding protein FerR (iron transport regulator)